MITSIHEQLKNREIRAVDLVEKACKVAYNNAHNSYISVTQDLAIQQAEKSDERYDQGKPLGPLDGIPFSLKDLFVTRGIRTTAGSRTLANYIAPYEGHVSERLQAAGACLVGKVGCDEFGMGSTNQNTAFGPVANPKDQSRVAGGSSGGSAASVAEGSAEFSIGTDTGGSIRLPSNFCGTVGFKPSYGRVSRYGQIAYGSSFDQAGPVTKSVMDAAHVLAEISKYDARDATNHPESKLDCTAQLDSVTADLKGKKIAFDPTFLEATNDGVRSQLTKALEQIKSQGAELVEVSMPHLKYSVSVYYILATSEASANLARFDGIHYGHRAEASGLEDSYRKSRRAGLGDEVKRRILLGTFSLSAGHQDAFFAKAAKVRRLISQDFDQAFSKADVFFSPVCASTAFAVQGEQDPLAMYMNDIFTIPANLAGLPAISVPFGNGSDGLPTGPQFLAPRFQDGDLLSIARAFELGAQ